MAEKSFGIKEIKFFGSSPKIESPNNLNLNAVNVAISTNATIGGTLSVTGNVSVGGTLTYEDVTNIDSVGLVTAREGVFIPDNKTLKIGNTASNPDFIFYHDGTSTILTNNMNGTTGAIVIQPKSGADGIKTFPDGAAELYFNSNKKLETSNTGVTVTGTLVATTFSGSGASLTSLPAANLTGTLPAISGANLTNLPAATPTNSDIQVVYTVTANGASAYRFAGNGVVSTADDPDLYLIRGQKYRFINNSGGSHPFQIRTAAGADGVAYSTGVTNNGASSGNIDFAPTYDSPAQLVYQCTSHSGMVGNIYLRDAAGNDTNVGVTTFVTNTDGTTNILTLHADANGTNNGVASIKLMGNTGNHAAFIKGGHTTNGDTILTFHTDEHASGINPEERLRIDNAGRVKVGNNTRPASDANEGAQLRVTGAPLTRNQYYSPAGHYYGSFGYTDNTYTKSWIAVDSSYAQSSAVSAGIFLSAFHQDANSSACGFTIKNLRDGNPLVISSVVTASSVSNPAVETERLRIKSDGDVIWNDVGTPTPGYANSIEGMGFEPRNGTIFLSRADNFNLHLNRNNDGKVITFAQSGTQKFNIGVSNSGGELRVNSGTGNGTERVAIRASDGRVIVNDDVEFDTGGSGGIFGKIVRSAAAYTANSNIDIGITQGNYIFSVRSAGVYHYNGIFMVTYYDSADKSSEEVVHGDYQTSATHSVIHNGSNNGTFRLSFSRAFTTLTIRQLKIS